MNRPLLKHYLAEIPLSSLSNGQRYLIGDVPVLKGRKVYAIESHSSGTYSATPGGNIVVAGSALRFLTLSFSYDHKESDQEEISNLPYLSIESQTNWQVLTRLPGVKFDLSKSFLTVWDITGFTVNQSALISFFYE